MFKVCIQNLGKYNEGELVYEWVDLPISDEELAEVYKRIGINFDEPDENGNWYEETMIADYENDIGYKVGEWDSIEDLNEIAERLGDLDDSELEVLQAAIEHGFIMDNDDIANFDPYEYTLIDADDDEALGYYIVDEWYGGVEHLDKDTQEMYFDYDSFGRDIRLEFSVWDVFDGDPDDEDDVREFCEQYGVDDIEDVDAYTYYDGPTDSDIGYYCVDNFGFPSEMDMYFDYEGFGRDYAINADGGFTSKGFIERS
jgi:hypothetical protein